MQKKLTKLQAYNALLIFLNVYYWQIKSDNLSDFITYAFFWFDKKTADPAAWQEWKDALSLTARQDNSLRNINRLTESQALQAVINFFKNYCDLYTETPLDMIKVLNTLKDLQQNKSKSAMWKEWANAINEILCKEDPRFYIQAVTHKN